MEQAGVRVDGPALAAQSQRIEQELQTLGVRIFELAGCEFNINSPRQLGEVLFDRLQLPALKRTGKTRAVSNCRFIARSSSLALRAQPVGARRTRPRVSRI